MHGVSSQDAMYKKTPHAHSETRTYICIEFLCVYIHKDRETTYQRCVWWNIFRSLVTNGTSVIYSELEGGQNQRPLVESLCAVSFIESISRYIYYPCRVPVNHDADLRVRPLCYWTGSNQIKSKNLISRSNYPVKSGQCRHT